MAAQTSPSSTQKICHMKRSNESLQLPSSADEDQPGGQGEYHLTTTTTVGVVSTSESGKMRKLSEYEKFGPKTVLASLTRKTIEVKSNIRELYSKVKKQGIIKLPIQQLKELLPSVTDSRKNDEISLQEYFKPDFTSAVEALLDCLLEFTVDYDLYKDASQLVQTWEQLQKKEILVSMFGRFNAGKSTLLNVILATRLLPVRKVSETGVKVMIKHSESVHRGPCPEQMGGDKSKSCHECPFLIDDKPSAHDVIAQVVHYRGAEAIRNALSDFNKGGRERKRVVALHEFKVYANIPAIGGVPDPWSVYLVDNPGCGDVNEGLSNLAETSMKSSSAYVYIVHYKELADADDVESFKRIHTKDPTVFRDERLVVAVTHYDIFYRGLEDHDKIPADVIKKRVCSTIQSAIGEKFPEDMVIPLCSTWAKTARLLRYKPHDADIKTAALESLQYYDEDPRGQAESIQNAPPDHIAERLEKASGILKLEERIHRMSGSCLDIWISTIENDCARYTQEGLAGLRAAIKKLEEEKAKKGRELDELQMAHEEMEKYYHQLEQTTESDPKKAKTTRVYKELEAAYSLDIQSAKTEAEKEAEEKLAAFKKAATSKARQSYTKDNFETDVSGFLDTTSMKLESIYGKSQFFKMNKTCFRQRFEAGDMYGVLKANAARFCGIKWHLKSVGDEEEEEDRTPQDVIRDHSPKLNDVKVEAEPLLNGWKKIWHQICELFRHKERLGEQDVINLLEELTEKVKKGCAKYIEDIKPYVVEHFHNQYAEQIRQKLDNFDKNFGDKINERKEHIDKLKSELEDCNRRMNMLTRWCKHFQDLETHVHKKAMEFRRAQRQA